MKKGRIIKILASGTALLFVVGVFIIYFIGFKEPAQSVEELIPDQKETEGLSEEVRTGDKIQDIDELPRIVDNIGADKELAEDEKDTPIVDQNEQKDETTPTSEKPNEPEKPIGDTKPVGLDKPKVNIPDREVNPNAEKDAQAADDDLLKEMMDSISDYVNSIESKRTVDEATGSFDPIQAK